MANPTRQQVRNRIYILMDRFQRGDFSKVAVPSTTAGLEAKIVEGETDIFDQTMILIGYYGR